MVFIKAFYKGTVRYGLFDINFDLDDIADLFNYFKKIDPSDVSWEKVDQQEIPKHILIQLFDSIA